MKEHTLSVRAIRNGTVIDHIPVGGAMAILHHFALTKVKNYVTVGFNLPSSKGGFKDLIKLEEVFFTEERIKEIAFFAPHATINIIKDFKVIKKSEPTYPDHIAGIFSFPNSNCASHGEPVESFFTVHSGAKNPLLQCHYCEKIFPFLVVYTGKS